MPILITGLFAPSGGAGAFDLYAPEDIQAGDVNVVLQAVAGGSFKGGSHATSPAGEIVAQVKTTTGAPSHSASLGTLCWNSIDLILYVNNNGSTGWTAIGTGSGSGPAGPVGIPGFDGEAGLDGFPGPAGPAGATGATGTTGAQGSAGPAGLPGIDGLDGLDALPMPGPQGTTGAGGQPGMEGLDGADGLDGIPGAAGPIGAAGPMGPPGMDGDGGELFPGPLYSDAQAIRAAKTLLKQFTVTLETPTASEDFSLPRFNVPVTITKIVGVLTGDYTSVTINPKFSTDRSAAGTALLSAATAITSLTTGTVITSFADATIPADSFLWLETTAKAGTAGSLSLTFFYTED